MQYNNLFYIPCEPQPFLFSVRPRSRAADALRALSRGCSLPPRVPPTPLPSSGRAAVAPLPLPPRVWQQPGQGWGNMPDYQIQSSYRLS